MPTRRLLWVDEDAAADAGADAGAAAGTGLKMSLLPLDEEPESDGLGARARADQQQQLPPLSAEERRAVFRILEADPASVAARPGEGEAGADADGGGDWHGADEAAGVGALEL